MTAQAFVEALATEGIVGKIVEHDEFGGLALLPADEMKATTAQKTAFKRIARQHKLRVTGLHIVWKVNGLEITVAKCARCGQRFPKDEQCGCGFRDEGK